MPDREYAKDLLIMARKDFDALRGMLSSEFFADEIFGFHAQQAIEKSLKAWLVLLSIDFPLTHDLSRLIALLEDARADSVTTYLPLVEFNVYAVQARYQAGFLDDEEELDRPAIVADVHALMLEVETLHARG